MYKKNYLKIISGNNVVTIFKTKEEVKINLPKFINNPEFTVCVKCRCGNVHNINNKCTVC